jgi:hypothetical protein
MTRHRVGSAQARDDGEIQDRGRVSLLSFILGSLIVLAATVVPLFRQTGARSWQTVWAEDGFEYFQQAHQHGALAVLLRGSHGGYLQLPSRLLASGATLIPIGGLSVYLALSGTLIGALLALFLYHTSTEWIPSRPVRLALASLVVLMPVLGIENTANITNVIWMFAAVAPWALVSLSERGRDVALRGIVAFLAAASTSLCFLFFPLAVGFAVIRRTRAAVTVAAAFTLGLAVQGAVVLHTKELVSYIPPSFFDVQRTVKGITDATGLHVFATFLIGAKGASAPWLTQHNALVVGSILLFVAILALLMMGADSKRQTLAFVLVAYAVITFVVPAWSRRDTAPRYSVIPELLLASAIAILVADPTRGPTHWVARVGRPLFVIQVVIVTIVGFSVTNYRSESPRWSSALTLARKAQCHGASPNKLVKVQTDKFNAWPVVLACHDLSP